MSTPKDVWKSEGRKLERDADSCIDVYAAHASIVVGNVGKSTTADIRLSAADASWLIDQLIEARAHCIGARARS